MRYLTIIFILFFNSLYGATLSQERVIANYVYNFAAQTSWPDDAIDDEFNIYILSSNKKLLSSFNFLLKNKKLHSRNIHIKLSKSKTIPYITDLVFVDKMYLNKYRDIFLQVQNRAVLLVSNNYDNKRVVMINLTKTKDKKVTFEINKANIINQRLSINPKIILLGGTEIDIEKLYKTSNDILIKKENELQVQLKQAKYLRTEIINSKNTNKTLQKDIKLKNKKLKLLNTDLNKLQKFKKRLNLELKKQQKVLKQEIKSTKKMREDYTLANANLDKMNSKLSTQEKNLNSKNIDVQNKELELNLQSKNKEIKKQDKTIDTQQDFLLYLSMGLILFFLLSLVIFILLRKKSKLNEKLQNTQVALEEAIEEAQYANKSKINFLAHMSHELRTPLNNVLGYSQLLVKDHEISAKNITILNTINRSGGYLLSLINDVLEISKIEIGDINLNPISFDLYIFLSDIHSMFEQRVLSNGLSLTITKAKDLPQFITADINKIRQILINIIANAIKFTTHGGIQIRVKHNEKEKKLLIEVEDSGDGISEKEINKLFAPFKQTIAEKLGGEGAGLGLSIVLEYINIMGGTIDVKSKVAYGTIFYISLPLDISDESIYQNSKPKQVISLKQNYKGTKVLIADDNKTNNELLKQTLEAVGFDVTAVMNGFEAYRLFKQIKPPIVFLDLEMPLMDGFEAVKQMRELEYAKDTSIIAITASVFRVDKIRAIESGFNALIHKPFKDYEIFDAIALNQNIEFIYDDNTNNSKDENENIQLDLTSIDENLRQKLLRAVRKNNISTTNKLLKEISVKNPKEVKVMQNLADNFEYEKLYLIVKGS